MSVIKFRNATSHDVAAVLNIVNLAYRTEGGWTTESHLVVGDRLVEDDCLLALQQKNQRIILAEKNNKVVGCIEIKMEGTQAYLGMLAVLPNQQNEGIASQLLAHAETLAKEELKAIQSVMFVLDVRSELLQYYYRKGYQRADEYMPFPVDLNVGKPINQNLMFEKIVKSL